MYSVRLTWLVCLLCCCAERFPKWASQMSVCFRALCRGRICSGPYIGRLVRCRTIPCCAIVCGSAPIFEGERCRFFSFPLLRCSSCCAERLPNWELHFVICFSVLYRARCGDALQLYFALHASPAFVCFD